MRLSSKNKLLTEEMRENIVNSMIASFRIEKINISEKEAHEIYQKVRKKIKKSV